MTRREIGRVFLGGLFMAALVTGAVATADAKDGQVTRKLKKQITVLERVLDEVLVDSPNFLVGSRRNTHGLYLDEFGVLFSFEASLISRDEDFPFGITFGDWGKGFTIDREGDKVTISWDRDEDGDGEDDVVVIDKEEMREKHEESQRELYEAGKAELTEALMDYGETLTTLRDDQWVAVAAFLRDSDFFAHNKISTLVFKAKLSDLRAYAQGDISEDAMAKRVVQEEY
jgi:hypothetical protein